MRKRPNKERFEEKINKTKTCWLWTGYVGPSGYGEFCYNGESERSHRVSHMLYNGSIPDKLCVMHSCDNKLCVNPKHLSLGTICENIMDRQSKNRQAKGENQANSKLTEKQVLEIRAKYKPWKYSINRLSIEYGVHNSVISRIVNNLSWKHI